MQYICFEVVSAAVVYYAVYMKLFNRVCPAVAPYMSSPSSPVPVFQTLGMLFVQFLSKLG